MPAQDVGLQAVAQHHRLVGRCAQQGQGLAVDAGLGLANDQRFLLGRGFEKGHDGARAGHNAPLGGEGGVGVGLNPGRARSYRQGGFGHAGVAGVGVHGGDDQRHVLGPIDNLIPGFLHGRADAVAADDDDPTGRGKFLFDIKGCGQRRGEDGVFVHTDIHLAQTPDVFGGRAGGVVGEKEEGRVRLLQGGDEFSGRGQRALALIQHAVHVDEPGGEGGEGGF